MGDSLQPIDNNQKQQEAILPAPTAGQERKRSSFHLRLPRGLSPQTGQGQVPSPHDNRPHSHRCNRRALLGGLCHPPHIPLSGTCRLWRGPGDLSAPSRRWGGRGVDGGIRAERRFSLDPKGVGSGPKNSEGNWDWIFSPKESKGSGCIERGGPSKAPNEEGCPQNGPGGKKK